MAKPMCVECGVAGLECGCVATWIAREWSVRDGSVLHVYPLDDLRDHETGEGVTCWCRPRLEDEGAACIVVHNSMDGREDFETGHRKVS